MDQTAFSLTRSSDIAYDSLQFNEEIESLITPQSPENGTSFMALLELPPTQAVELLQSPEPSGFQSTLWIGSRNLYSLHSIADESPPPPTISGSLALRSKVPSSAGTKVKDESVVIEENATNSNSSLHPVMSDTATESKGLGTGKRKERDQKGKGLVKKIKSESSQEAQILPYVHVRARRGQATDSHSLAERARREKINARMKLLQELVPGCSKISGTALVLDEIINHVQSLQHQVEMLSMKLAAVTPRMDFRIDSLIAPEMGFLLDSSLPCMIPPPIWPDEEQFEQQWHFNTLHQTMWGKEFDAQNQINPEVTLFSYDSSANASKILHSSY